MLLKKSGEKAVEKVGGGGGGVSLASPLYVRGLTKKKNTRKHKYYSYAKLDAPV